MADFVSNFLDGLKERRLREERQAALAEQTRQFERQQAARMFEFNAQRAAQQAQFNFNKQQAERQNKRQEFQDTLSIADLISQGVADESIEGVDEFAGGQTIESPSGQRIRLLTPEERATRKFQLDMGIAKNRIDQGLEMIGEIGGEEARAEAEKLFKDPRVLAQTLFDVKLGNQPAVPQNFQAAIIRDTEQAVSEGRVSRNDATKTYQKLFTQGQAAAAPKVVGPEGQLTNPPTFDQQRKSMVNKIANTIRFSATGPNSLSGLTPEQVIAQPEEAAQKLYNSVIKAMINGTFPGRQGQKLDQKTIETIAPQIQEAVLAVIEDIKNINKKPATSGLQLPGVGGTTLTDQEKQDASR